MHKASKIMNKWHFSKINKCNALVVLTDADKGIGQDLLKRIFSLFQIY